MNSMSVRSKIIVTDMGVDTNTSKLAVTLWIDKCEQTHFKDLYVFATCTGLDGLNINDLSFQFHDSNIKPYKLPYNYQLFDGLENHIWEAAFEILESRASS